VWWFSPLLILVYFGSGNFYSRRGDDIGEEIFLYSRSPLSVFLLLVLNRFDFKFHVGEIHRVAL